MRSRGSRHGREPRNAFGRALGRGTGTFTDIVSETVEFLKTEWPYELSKLTWRVADAPQSTRNGELPRWFADANSFRITIYRIPIERLTHVRRPDPVDERFHIEQFVFFAVGELIGKDPWDLMPDRFKD